MTLEVQMMFHVMLLAVCLLCSVVTQTRRKDMKGLAADIYLLCLFFFVQLELLYWVGGWLIRMWMN